ncbi:MAG: SMC-Scp complex subunit ScpB, partial [[Mycobacterium] stephanolepidis]
MSEQTTSVEGSEESTELDVSAEPILDELDEFVAMTDEELGSTLEALVLVVDTPIGAAAVATVVAQPLDRVAEALQRISEILTDRASGIDLRETADGWRMYTRAQYAPYVEKLLLDGARSKLTRAALETLA